jgi:hypothetical protein
MKFYCQNCEAIYEHWDQKRCPACLENAVIKISSYETVAAWEQRKGETYPDTAPVWVMFKVKEAHVRLDATKKVSQSYWVLYEWGETKGWRKNNPIVVATEKGSPPDNWRPE